jgi:hypothetical protein
MQIHNMAEIKAIQFLMDYYDGPTLNTDDSLAANPEDEASSKIEQVPEKQEDNGKPGSEERAPSTKLTTITQLTRTEKGSEPVNDTEKEASSRQFIRALSSLHLAHRQQRSMMKEGSSKTMKGSYTASAKWTRMISGWYLPITLSPKV